MLAVKGTVRIAFEVQWSRQTLAETEALQAQYRRDGVRGCWLFRHPPRELTTFGNKVDLRTREDLPLFAFTEEGGFFNVYVHRHVLPLELFIQSMLEGRVAFRPHVTARSGARIRLQFFGVACWRCHRVSHVYCLQQEHYVAAYGECVSLHDLGEHPAQNPGKEEPAPVPPEFLPEIRAAADAFLRTPEGRALKMGEIKERFSRTVGGSYLSFGCHSCDELFGRVPLHTQTIEARCEDRWDPVCDTVLSMSEDRSVAHAHWCLPIDGTWCTQ